MTVPARPKIYHIVHIDRLASIISDGFLWCDSLVKSKNPSGSVIGMGSIKQRRLSLPLRSHSGLNVGDCVPFYFCPRSIMLYLINQANHPELTYRGGQGPIIHLQADLNTVVNWAQQNGRRWAFTTSNAGSIYFEDRSDLAQLHEVDWTAVQANQWQNCKEGKQAEFLLEQYFPWHLIEKIGVQAHNIYQQTANTVSKAAHRPAISIEQLWYY